MPLSDGCAWVISTAATVRPRGAIRAFPLPVLDAEAVAYSASVGIPLSPRPAVRIESTIARVAIATTGGPFVENSEPLTIPTISPRKSELMLSSPAGLPALPARRAELNPVQAKCTRMGECTRRLLSGVIYRDAAQGWRRSFDSCRSASSRKPECLRCCLQCDRSRSD